MVQPGGARFPEPVDSTTESRSSLRATGSPLARRWQAGALTGALRLEASGVGHLPPVTLEGADLALDHGDGLGVTDIQAEGLLDQQEPRDARERQDDRSGGPALGIEAVAGQHAREQLELARPELAGVVRDLGPDRLPMVGEGDELHRPRRVRRVVDELPEPPERLRRRQDLGQAVEAAVGAAPEQR